jgi:hypothetical protein
MNIEKRNKIIEKVAEKLEQLVADNTDSNYVPSKDEVQYSIDYKEVAKEIFDFITIERCKPKRIRKTIN